MTEHKTLAAALAAFQAEMPKIHKGKTAKVPTKAGGSYSYTYADLADMAQQVHPILAAHGLAFAAMPRMIEGSPGKYELAARLMHSGSDEHIEGALPIQGGTFQEWGSALTYSRRYLLGCLTGVVTDDDDDGQAAQRGQQQAHQRSQQQAAKRATQQAAGRAQGAAAQQQQDTGEAMTDPTRRKLFALMGRAPGLADETMQRDFLTDTVGREIESRGSLTQHEAGVAISRLEAWSAGEQSAAWTPFGGAA